MADHCMPEVIIADSSCLIALHRIGHLNLLKELFGCITITAEVAEESKMSLPNWIQTKTVKNVALMHVLQTNLDCGEASALALGLEYRNPLILIDERKGRKRAVELGLKIKGTLGILFEAYHKGLIPNLKTEIDALRQINFRMSNQLIDQILKNSQPKS